MISLKSILFPTDFSPYAQYAYKFACGLARDNKALLEIVHVKPPPIVAMGEFALPEPVDYTPSADQSLHRLQPAGIAVNHFLLEGDPVDQIVRLATEHNSDVIVMATHGRTGLGRLLMGSVAEQVVRKAPCPVLTIKVPTATLEKHGLVPAVTSSR